MKSFDEIRTNFMNVHQPPSFLRETFLAKKLAKGELLEDLNGTEGEISERTLAYYIHRGIVERPYVSRKKSGKDKESYFSPQDLNRVRIAKFLQKKGFTLEQTKERIKHFDRLLAVIKKEDNDYLNYFKRLARLLIDNVPDNLEYMDVEHYFSLILPDEKEVLKKLLEKDIATVVGRVNHVAEANVFDFSGSQKIFDTLLEDNWDKDLEALFYELVANDATQEEVLADVLLRNIPTRLLVFTRYFYQVKRTLDAMEKMYLEEH